MTSSVHSNGETDALGQTPPSALQLAMVQPNMLCTTDNSLMRYIKLICYSRIQVFGLSSVQKRRKGSLEKREQMMLFALRSFKEQLGLESEASLEGNVELREIPEGFRIMEEDSLKDAALVLVVAGCFSVSQKSEDGKEKEIHLCYTGGMLGQLQVLTGEASIFTVEAKTHSKVACLSRKVVFDLMLIQPDVTLQLASSVTEHLSG